MEFERPRGTDPETRRRAPRRVIASYGSYPEAQEAVDYLSDERFPVERVSIVDEDQRFVEQVIGRRGYGQAALQGADSGAMIGAFFGFSLGLFSLADPLVSALVLVLYGLVFGAILGAVLGLVSRALAGGMQDFSSVGGIEVGRYNGMFAEEASRPISEPRH